MKNRKSKPWLSRESMANSIANLGQTTHGHSTKANMHPLHRVWREMRQRCTNPNSNRYVQYGARGIRVCARWDSFTAFLTDMGPRPAGVGPGGRSLYSLDRIDNNGDYEPSNCQWSTTKQQARNMSSNRRITIDGRTFTLVEWLERVGLRASTFHRRMSRGWSEVEALRIPAGVRR